VLDGMVTSSSNLLYHLVTVEEGGGLFKRAVLRLDKD